MHEHPEHELERGLLCINQDDFPGYSSALFLLRTGGFHELAERLHQSARSKKGFLMLTGTEVTKPQYAGVSP